MLSVQELAKEDPKDDSKNDRSKNDLANPGVAF
jgi:hypothetical protein